MLKPRKDTRQKELEKAIIRYILQGLTRKEIANKLNYSRSAISYQINNLFEKYNARTRHEFTLQFMAKVIYAKNQEIDNCNIRIYALENEIVKLKQALYRFKTQTIKENKFLYK